jgi:hypothetical protein
MVLQPVINPTLHLLLPRRILNAFRQWAWCKVEVYELARVSILRSHLTADPMAPVATLHHVLGVPELLHELIKQACGVLQRPACTGRPIGKAEAWQTRHDDVERRVFGISRMREWAPDRAELPEGARPAVAHDERDRVLALRASVDEMEFDVFDACGIVRVLVNLVLDFVPVVV